MSARLPDPELEHGTDPIAAYLAGLEQRVDRLRALCRVRHTPQRYDALLKALKDVRQARLDHYGVDCPACRGKGFLSERVYGLGHACDEVEHDCPNSDCRGTGVVLPDEAERWILRAREMGADL